MTIPANRRRPGRCAHCMVHAIWSKPTPRHGPHRRRGVIALVRAAQPTTGVVMLTTADDSEAILAALRATDAASSTTDFHRLERDRLSAREREVLPLLARGLTNPQIAQHLTISTHTVRSHVEHILTKLDVNDRTHAAVRAIELGYVTLGSAIASHPG